MRPLTTSELLAVWEHGLNQPMLQKTLYLLNIACPEMDVEDISRLSIGERDTRLFKLREWMFGTRLLNIANCPGCSERLEWETDVADMCIQSSKPYDLSQEFDLEKDDYQIRFRLPNSLDLATVLAERKEKSRSFNLLALCILICQYGGKECSVDTLPDHVLQALSCQIEEKDPQANISIKLTCPACGHQWEAIFDIGEFLWCEINNWAEQTLRVVHKLAQTYGWSENEILNMSPLRRQLYLMMVG